MIKYEGIKNVYYYNPQDLKNVINILESVNFYNDDNCTQENVSEFVKAVNSFVTNIKMEKQTAILERHETEEEARKYFGQEFIDKFDRLLTELDKQQTIVALHGTSINNCTKICETGLRYKLPSLTATAVEQQMAFGQGDMHYQKYETLLNWTHHQYKGLVIIAVPYECYYKEGLWNHFQDTGTSYYGGQDYRIDPDFIAGFIDVVEKKIVINPKYNRKHNYNGYDKDNEIFREDKDMDNEKFMQNFIELELELKKEINTTPNELFLEEKKDKPIDISNVAYIIDDLQGIFHSINFGYNCMSEEKFKTLLVELSHGFYDIKSVIPLLKTKEQEDIFNTSYETKSPGENENLDWNLSENVDGGNDLFDILNTDDTVNENNDVEWGSENNFENNDLMERIGRRKQ